MKVSYWYLMIPLLLLVKTSLAQADVTDEMTPLMAEAYELATLEKAGDIAIHLLHPKFTREQEGAFFSYNNLDSYKVIFWDSKKSPMIYATVTLDTHLNERTAKIERTARPFSIREGVVKKMYTDAAITAMTDSNARAYEKSYPVCQPVLTKSGYKVYLYSRWHHGLGALYGTERIYHFDDDSKITDKISPHSKVDGIGFTNSRDTLYTIGYHNHRDEKQEHFTVADMATALYYNYDGFLTEFLMNEDKTVYLIDLATLRIRLWDRNTFIREYVPRHPEIKSLFTDPIQPSL